MEKSLENKVLKTIKKYNLINENDRIVIGVSGGPDSMCLLNILNNLKEDLHITLFVAHINHMIREEAKEETEYVKNFCENLNIDCFIKYIDVISKANEEKIGTEEAGRTARYSFFEEVAQKVNANKIAIAHNCNDNAETVLMNIIRGTGTDGLKGIEPIRDNKFIRPIIECERSEIEEYCEEKELHPRIDKSNFENIYTRNKIRNILIPQIKEEFNPNIVEALCKLSKVARNESTFINNYSNQVMNELLISKDEENKILVLDWKKFNKQDCVIKNRIIINGIKFVLGSTQGIEKIHIDDIVQMCENNIGNKFLSPKKGIKVSVGKNKITFSTTEIGNI